MKAFLITMLVLYVIALGGLSFNLQGGYPRQRTISRREDMVALFIQVGLLVWVINLLTALA